MADAIVAGKIDTIDRCLTRIRTTFADDPARLEDVDAQDVIVLNVIRACQAAIDLSMQVVARDRLGLPDDLASVFRLLQGAGWISADLCQRMENMVGFRNVAVHEYKQLDREILLAIVRRHLVDFEELCAALAPPA